jgi:hypothetical protein
MINYIHYFMRNSSKKVAHKITNHFFNSLNLIIKLIIMPEHLILILFTKEQYISPKNISPNNYTSEVSKWAWAAI